MLVVGSMVGTGIFTTSGILLRELGSPQAVLAAWGAGAVVALCGAVSYAELASALPQNGGEYRLLGRIYHPALGLTAALVSLLVGFSAPLAAASTAHAVHVGLGSRLQAATTTLEILLILAFIVLGGVRGDASALRGDAAALAAIAPSAFAAPLVFVVFAYSGWNAAVYLAGELGTPARTIPRALLAGTLLVAALYLGLTAVFLSAVPPDRLAGVIEVGHVAAVALLGPVGGSALSALIALVLASSVSALLMAGPRVYEQVGCDFPLLAALDRRTRHGGPAMAVTVQAAAAAVLMTTASFEALLRYVGFTLSVTTTLAVVGVLVLRWREPALPRPYRAWGYPVTPLLFAGTSTWIVLGALRDRPGSSWAGIGTLVGGLVLHVLLARRSGEAR